MWIEILYHFCDLLARGVAFRKEGVDWNITKRYENEAYACRLPQGRCGLKYPVRSAIADALCRLPQGRCGLKSNFINCGLSSINSRLPQGRCGLKFHYPSPGATPGGVAFRKEGVDWNFAVGTLTQLNELSPSARKVWIEIRSISASVLLQPSPSARKVRIKILTYFSRHFTSPSLHIPCWQRTSLSQGI